MTGNLEAGRFKIGAGATEKKIGGRIAATKLGGMVPIISDNHLLLHDKSLSATTARARRKEWYTKYAGMNKMGVIILAGTPENFSEWAKSKACREEVAEGGRRPPVGLRRRTRQAARRGRPPRFVPVRRRAQANEPRLRPHARAASTWRRRRRRRRSSNGKGAIVWASGNYYKGDLKNSRRCTASAPSSGRRHQVRRPVREFGLQRHGHEDARERQGREGRLEGRQVPRVSGLRIRTSSVQGPPRGRGRKRVRNIRD